MPEPIAVLIVCLGNICRSPAGETMLATFAGQCEKIKINVDSCGTGDWHLGSAPDPRMQRAAQERNFFLTSVARGIRREDFEKFDYILAVDREVQRTLELRVETEVHRAKIYLISEFSTRYQGKNVPDPYYGKEEDFQHALDILEDSCRGFISHLLKK